MTPAGAHFEIIEAKDGARWRLQAANGRFTAPSGQAFRDHTDARRAILDHVRTVFRAAGVPDAAIGDLEANVRIEIIDEADVDDGDTAGAEDAPA